MKMFKELIDELMAAGNLSMLRSLKLQCENDFLRIGTEDKLTQKYHMVCEAIRSVNQLK